MRNRCRTAATCCALPPVSPWLQEALTPPCFITFVLCCNSIFRLLGWEGGEEKGEEAARVAKVREKSLLQNFPGESFLCSRKEKPYRIIKYFSREIK